MCSKLVLFGVPFYNTHWRSCERSEVPEYCSDRVTHLQMIQDVITRMANESGRMKRFALLTLGVMASASVASQMWVLALFAAVLVAVFGSLDAKYLRMERLYRVHFEAVRQKKGPTDFAMKVDKAMLSEPASENAWLSWSVRGFYVALIGMGLSLAIVVASTSPPLD